MSGFGVKAPGFQGVIDLACTGTMCVAMNDSVFMYVGSH